MRKSTKDFIKDERAQVAGIFSLIIMTIVASIAFMTLGSIFDELILFNINDPLVSPQRVGVVNMLSRFFNAMPVLVVIIIIIFVIKNALSRRYEEV